MLVATMLLNYKKIKCKKHRISVLFYCVEAQIALLKKGFVVHSIIREIIS